jgi:RNA polymerase sigma factor (sigma-70 family)
MSQQTSPSKRHVRNVNSLRPGAAGDDARLLDRFVHQGDEDAFASLVRRYGPMVLGVCRRVLHHRQDAEDAAQDTFLLLARKATSIRAGASVRGWLHTAAYRVALRARAKTVRRRQGRSFLEDIADEEPGGAPPDRLVWRELCESLDAALGRIPEQYRSAFILCQLEGQTGKEAADCLDCPIGTVRSRVGRAKRRLREQLKSSGS